MILLQEDLPTLQTNLWRMRVYINNNPDCSLDKVRTVFPGTPDPFRYELPHPYTSLIDYDLECKADHWTLLILCLVFYSQSTQVEKLVLDWQTSRFEEPNLQHLLQLNRPQLANFALTALDRHIRWAQIIGKEYQPQ